MSHHMGKHYKNICPLCQGTIQCRCMGPKETTRRVCRNCVDKAENNKDKEKLDWTTCADPGYLRDQIRNDKILAYNACKASNLTVREGENPINTLRKYIIGLEDKLTEQETTNE